MTKSKQQTFHLTGKQFKTEDLTNLFEAETGYQIDRLADYLRTFIGKPVKVIIAPTRRPKTKEALGMYWGALVPATAMDTAGLPYESEKIYDDYRFYRKQGKIGQKNLDVADTMLRLEWHYEYTYRVDKKLYRVPKDLSTQDNGALLALIDKIMEWRAQNGYPYIDIEKYKERKNSAMLLTE